MATKPVYPGHLTRQAHIRTKHLPRHSRYPCAMRLKVSKVSALFLTLKVSKVKCRGSRCLCRMRLKVSKVSVLVSGLRLHKGLLRNTCHKLVAIPL